MPDAAEDTAGPVRDAPAAPGRRRSGPPPNVVDAEERERAYGKWVNILGELEEVHDC